MSGFRSRSRTFNRLSKTLRERAREQNLDPSDIEIYPSKRPSKTRQQVTPSLNAVQISDRMRFTLRKTGEPFKYHNVMTKRYSFPKLQRLLAIDRQTIVRYVRDGIFPEAALIIQGKNRRHYWLYHQVEPMYVWYHQMRGRGIQNIHANFHQKEINELHRRLRMTEVHFWKKFGQDGVTEYERYAGPYGVLWLVDDEKII